jgi:hypothetical protein
MPIIKAQFKKPNSATSLDFRSNTARIIPIIQYIQQTDQSGLNWFLMGDTEADSLLYTAFDDQGNLTTAAEAVLETRFKGDPNRFLGVWNGQSEKNKAGSITLTFREGSWPDWTLEIDYKGKDIEQIGGVTSLQNLLSIIARTLDPLYITVARHQYFQKQVFQDRPGVGWMLYLPTILTAQQVPEARALVPVIADNDKGKKTQLGTIVVSSSDEPFDDENSEHVKVANSIEIRLVDQDILKTFKQMR